ncbi:hypothetical protein AVEN_201542-1 [Araneus ventricosus]|uniref:Ig-like domain-containing protein n=1 Tax=Araneus ventricosus TaxID=182803 RepID=A0A4Y2PAU1_ARAVE|nr:hypothetical protein AVEN_201542-1 [Araneus ventricosus]
MRVMRDEVTVDLSSTHKGCNIEENVISYSASKDERDYFLNISNMIMKQNANFLKVPPLIWIQNQLVGAPEGTDVYLECLTEAHPTSDNYWLRDDEAVVSKSTRYHPHITRNSYKTYMKLTIRNLQPEDYGSYQCVAKNTISETQGSIKLYRLVIPTPLPPKAVTEELLTYPTRKVITVSLTTEYRTLVTEIIRRDSMNTPGKQQKYGHGRGMW